MKTKHNESDNNQNTEHEETKDQVDVQGVGENHQVNEKDNQITELNSKVAELNDKYLRLYSEFDNFRRRTAKEKIELIQNAGEDVFKNLLPVVDDFERAVKSNAEVTDVKVITDGMNLIYNKFKNTLTQKGLEEMKSIGEPFNTDLHEAITNVPVPSEDLKGKVIDELEKGYVLNGKVIRFAKVVIGS